MSCHESFKGWLTIKKGVYSSQPSDAICCDADIISNFKRIMIPINIVPLFGEI
jgi:hypothetical protein